MNAAEARLSGVVALVTQDKGASNWLAKPGLATVEAYVRFPSELAEGVIFGIDQEFVEGINQPLYFKGGDWMALTGLQRNGTVWVATGTIGTMAGKPSKERTWKILSLGVPLKSDTWYRLQSVADFNRREFVRFTVEGPDLHKTIDLRGITLDYPNAIPFDGRAMSYYVWSMYGKSIGGNEQSPAAVYFDDISFGFLSETNAASAQSPRTFVNDNEIEGTAIPAQPLPPYSFFSKYVIPLKNYHEGTWYLERDDSRSAIVKVPFARSGKKAVICDAVLRNIAYPDWLNEILKQHNPK